MSSANSASPFASSVSSRTFSSVEPRKMSAKRFSPPNTTFSPVPSHPPLTPMCCARYALSHVPYGLTKNASFTPSDVAETTDGVVLADETTILFPTAHCEPSFARTRHCHVPLDTL